MRRLLDWLLYAQTGGQFREFVGLTTHFAPPDEARYRHYLPPALAMPKRPLVKVFLIDYLHVAPWPFARYQEWSVLLRASDGAREGWYPVTMPVTTWISRQGGHHLGFPKFVADSIDLVDEDDTVEGRVVASGRMDVTMSFRRGRVPSLSRWEREYQEADEILPDDLIVLKPVGVGPEIKRVRFEEAAPSSWEVRRGSVTIRGDAGGLLAQDRPLAASVHRFRGGMNLAPARPDTLPIAREAAFPRRLPERVAA